MKIFFTSNLLLSKESVVASRGFKSVEEMNETLIQNWNKVVSPNDIVYHLGNFAWDPLIADAALSRLNGKINFQSGDWDKALFENIAQYPQHVILSNNIFYIDSHDLVISYWPLMDWPGKEDGTIHIFGGDKYKTSISKNKVRINCNTENWDFKPIELDTVKSLIEMFSKEEK